VKSTNQRARNSSKKGPEKAKRRPKEGQKVAQINPKKGTEKKRPKKGAENSQKFGPKLTKVWT
jgi:hypothetical protein